MPQISIGTQDYLGKMALGIQPTRFSEQIGIVSPYGAAMGIREFSIYIGTLYGQVFYGEATYGE